LDYKVEDNCAIIELIKDFKKKDFRGFDSWGLAYVADVEKQSHQKIKKISFRIKTKKIATFEFDFEAFKRRVSYLKINNSNIHFEILRDGQQVVLYNADNLFNRPSDERVRLSVNDRGDDNTSGRLEKDFQAFLFGKKKGQDARTSDRLAVFGEHFFRSKGKNYGVLREFPTGVFRDTIKEDSRILQTEFVDIVSLNKWGKLAIIEIKLDDTQVAVISQLLDYALFFSCYIKQLLPVLKENLHQKIKTDEICCYVVNNHYHTRFNDILEYYSPNKDFFNFRFIKLTLGHIEENKKSTNKTQFK